MTKWDTVFHHINLRTYYINWLAVSHLPLVFCISGICKSGPTLTESPDPKYRCWPDWNLDQGSACAAGNVWKRISLRCGLGNHDGYFKWLIRNSAPLVFFRLWSVCLTRVQLIWTDLSCCGYMSESKEAAPRCVLGRRWMDLAMHAERQSGQVLCWGEEAACLRIKIIAPARTEKIKRKGTLVPLSMVQVDKPAINNFFVANQWKFLLIGEKGERAEGKCRETGRQFWLILYYCILIPRRKWLQNDIHKFTSPELVKQNWAVSQTDRLQIRYMAVCDRLYRHHDVLPQRWDSQSLRTEMNAWMGSTVFSAHPWH